MNISTLTSFEMSNQLVPEKNTGICTIINEWTRVSYIEL